MHRYRIKFTTSDGKTHYGIVDAYSDEAKAAKKSGEAIVQDAVYPRLHRVLESLLVDVPLGDFKMDPQTFKRIPKNEYEQYVQAELEKAEAADKAARSGLNLGRLCSVGVGDGHAYYVVTKVNKKTVQVEWRGFSPDRWVDRWLGWGGKFPLEQIKRQIEAQDALDRLFADRRSKRLNPPLPHS